MWTSCCNWFCLDSGGVEEGGAQHQAYSNSGYSGSPSPPGPEHVCKACGGRFDSLARKHVCGDCRKNFCGRCSAEQQDLQPRLCHTCQRFHGTLFQRAELMKLKVRDLREYLHLHEVSTHTCREKEELVDLVLNQQTPGEEAGPGLTTTTAPPTVTTPPSSTEPTPPPLTPEQDQTVAGQTPSDPEDSADMEAEPPAPGEQEAESQSSDAEEAAPARRRASLSDLSCVGDIEELSVRQLKEILARNFVDYKGCCEKWELMERVTRLYNEQSALRGHDAGTGTDFSAPSGLEENLCKICMDSPIDCVLLECGHMVTCTKCGKRMSECPICRQYVVRAVHIFRS